jgi:hypothetical protein
LLFFIQTTRQTLSIKQQAAASRKQQQVITMKAIPCSILVLLALSSDVSAAPNLELIKKKITNNSGRNQARRLINRGGGGGKWWEEEGFMVNGQPAASTTKITARSLQKKSQKQNHIGLGNGVPATTTTTTTINHAVAAAAPVFTAMRGLRATRRLVPKEGY